MSNRITRHVFQCLQPNWTYIHTYTSCELSLWHLARKELLAQPHPHYMPHPHYQPHPASTDTNSPSQYQLPTYMYIHSVRPDVPTARGGMWERCQGLWVSAQMAYTACLGSSGSRGRSTVREKWRGGDITLAYITATYVVNWWATKQLLIILTSRILRIGGLIWLLRRAKEAKTSWLKCPASVCINSCVVAHQFAIGIGSLQPL